MDIGSAIKELRKKKGLNQHELSENAQMTQSHISRLESNLRDPTMTTLKSIANGLKVPLPILLLHAMTAEDLEPLKAKPYKMLLREIRSTIT